MAIHKSEELDPKTIRVWLAVLLTMCGVVFGAGGAVATTRLGLGVLQEDVKELQAAGRQRAEAIELIRITQAQVVTELKHLNKQIEQAIDMRMGRMGGSSNVE